MRKTIFFYPILLFISFIMSGCSSDKNIEPDININSISINGKECGLLDNISINRLDTLELKLSLKSNKKDLNSFCTLYKDLSNYYLEIKDFNEDVAFYEGNAVSEKKDDDCIIIFRDGTYSTSITISTVIKESNKEKTQLFLYLFSEKEAATKIININVNE